jgi:fatty acid desaturase
MASDTATADTAWNDARLQARVNALRRTDNVTNWPHLAREYAFLGLVIGLTLAFYEWRETSGLAWAWNVLVTAAAVFLIGVGQHRLSVLGHEGSHYVLFRGRLLNEAASNWLCFFPLWSTTHNYRLIHMAHHQFVNDPELDPDLRFMSVSGHRFHHPMPRWRFVRDCVLRSLLWLPGLLRYILIRARTTALGDPSSPYWAHRKPSRLLQRLEVVYLLTLLAALVVVSHWQRPSLLPAVAAVWLTAALVLALSAPETLYPHSAVKPIGSTRWWSFQRLLYLTLLFTGLSWLTLVTGRPAWLYYFLLWLLPLGTTFSFLMMLREEVQHSNTGREQFRHSRLFEGNPLMRWAVFPLGMDYHLPHHLFPMVPHYNLGRVHALLREVGRYREEAVVVQGYLLARPGQD